MRRQDSPIGSFSNERNSIRKDVDRSVAVVVRVLFALSNKLRGRRITEVERDYTTWIASRRGKESFRFRLTMDASVIKTDNKIFSNLSLVLL